MSIVGRKVVFAGGGSSDLDTTDLSARMADIQFSFDGASPPVIGANTSKFGICHTTGGIYTEGEVYFDTGAALTDYSDEATTITTRTTVFGDLNLVENAVYVNEGSTWTQKIDHSFTAKEVKTNGLVIINDDEQRIVHNSFPVKLGGKLIVEGQLVII